MHVIGDDRTAIGGECAGHGHSVAAVHIRLGARGCCGGGHGQRPAQVQHVGAGQPRIATRWAEQRRIPLAAVVGEQGIQRWRHHVTQARHRQLVLVARVLQIGIHRQPGQHAVLGCPGGRRLAQQQVRPRAHAQPGEAGVDTRHIGLDHLGLRTDGLGQMRAGTRTQTVDAHPLVHLDGGRAEQRGQLAGGGAAHQVHLEIAFLRVHQPQRLHRIGLAAGIDGDHAERIAGDAHRSLQARQRLCAVQRGQTAAQQPPHDGDDNDEQYHQQPQHPREPATHPAPPDDGVGRL